MARTKKNTKTELDTNTILQSKEGAFLLMFLLTGNQKGSYIFASKGEPITTNENSLKSMANAFRNKNTTKQIEPMITEMFEKRAKQYLINKGYSVLTNSDAIKANATRSEIEDYKIELRREFEAKQSEPSIINDSKEVKSEDNQREKNEPVISDFLNLDLSNKDELLKELNRRYNATFDDKIKNDIAKMIIDVNNMKKAEIQDDKQQKQYYLPLRMCSDCPNLHTLYANNNIKK